MTYRIPFNLPAAVGAEEQYIKEAVASGHLAGDGVFTKRCQAMLEAAIGAPKVLMTTSCTHALELTAFMLELQPGDEVVVPSYSFVSTANAFAVRGAHIRFADVRPDTLNIDEARLEEVLTDRTKAVVVVHYAGIGCEMSTIGELAERRGFHIVEDNAHGLFGTYRGRPLGSFGSAAAQSFHETKNFTCGEGGALVLNDKAWIQRCEILREKGTNRSQFFRGQVDKYTWLDLGSSYLPSDLLAAFLAAQLEARDRVQGIRIGIWNRYRDELADWARARGVSLPQVPAECEHPAHMFYMLLPGTDERQALIDHLRERGVQAVFHYLPLHLSSMGRRFGGTPGDCPVTEDVSDRIIRLPLYHRMTEADQGLVLDAIRAFG